LRDTPGELDKLVADPGIIRNRMKIESAIKNGARAALSAGRVRKLRQILLAIRRWQAAAESLEITAPDSSTTAESDKFSRDLKQRGFSFVGSTVIYAHMQAWAWSTITWSTAFGIASSSAVYRNEAVIAML